MFRFCDERREGWGGSPCCCRSCFRIESSAAVQSRFGSCFVCLRRCGASWMEFTFSRIQTRPSASPEPSRSSLGQTRMRQTSPPNDPRRNEPHHTDLPIRCRSTSTCRCETWEPTSPSFLPCLHSSFEDSIYCALGSKATIEVLRIIGLHFHSLEHTNGQHLEKLRCQKAALGFGCLT
jgi:hypothetical protein